MNETKEIIKNTLIRALEPRGMSELITDEVSDKLDLLFHRLVETNAHMNITAITDPYGVALRHFADSMTASSLLPTGASVIDVGCGGGFPCLPLAILRNDLSFTALDSTAKKLTFVEKAAKELSLKVTTLAGRAEEFSRMSEHREKYDAAISRAVARLNILSELCIPFVKNGGLFVAMKGADADTERSEAQNAVKTLGAEVEKTERFTLEDAGERALILCRKTDKTPDIYPRTFAQIKKKPL